MLTNSRDTCMSHMRLYIRLQNAVTLTLGIRVTQGHQKRYPSTERMRLSCRFWAHDNVAKTQFYPTPHLITPHPVVQNPVEISQWSSARLKGNHGATRRSKNFYDRFNCSDTVSDCDRHTQTPDDGIDRAVHYMRRTGKSYTLQYRLNSMLQGSVVKHLWYGGIINDQFITNYVTSRPTQRNLRSRSIFD